MIFNIISNMLHINLLMYSHYLSMNWKLCIIQLFDPIFSKSQTLCENREDEKLKSPKLLEWLSLDVKLYAQGQWA